MMTSVLSLLRLSAFYALTASISPTVLARDVSVEGACMLQKSLRTSTATTKQASADSARERGSASSSAEQPPFGSHANARAEVGKLPSRPSGRVGAPAEAGADGGDSRFVAKGSDVDDLQDVLAQDDDYDMGIAPRVTALVEKARESQRKCSQSVSDSLPLIPYPTSVERTGPLDARFVMSRNVQVVPGPGVSSDDRSVQDVLHMLQNLSGKDSTDQKTVTLSLANNSAASTEAYSLKIGEDEVTMVAPSLAGLFYATQTLRQLLLATGPELPVLSIQDAPRFPWRGLHLDVSRHFFGADKVKSLLDVMASFKMNRFHWHLTDDQGWRLPIDGFPKLTEKSESSNESRQAYTVDEIRDVIAYASARHIEVVPEVDVPGHFAAAVAAYPAMGNFDIKQWAAPTAPLKTWGVHQITMGTSPMAWSFMESVAKTLDDLFPAAWVHIGGDEVPTEEWVKSPSAQRVMLKEGLASSEFQAYFNKRLENLFNARGRTVLGWDEVQHMGGLSPDATIMAWRNGQEVVQAARAGRNVINADMNSYYFDHIQGHKCCEPVAIDGSVVSLRQVYEHDPVPAELTQKEQESVLGAQGQLWSEYISTWGHMEYMAFPRAVALAERVWTSKDHQVDFCEFQGRLRHVLVDLDKRGVNYRKLDDAAWL